MTREQILTELGRALGCDPEPDAAVEPRSTEPPRTAYLYSARSLRSLAYDPALDREWLMDRMIRTGGRRNPYNRERSLARRQGRP